jgi:hypothetical protein
MKYRILSGRELVQSSKPFVGTSMVLLNEELRIEVGEGVITGNTSNGSFFSCVGNVVGRRSKDGLLSALESPKDFLVEAIDGMSLTDLVNQLEGRFLIIVVAPDGSCRARADRFAKVEAFVQKTKNGVTLASDLSMLPEDPSLGGFDQASLAHMMTYYGYCPPKRHTIYKDVKRLGVGDTAVLQGGAFEVETDSFVPLATEEYGELEHQKYVDIFLDHLRIAGSSEGNIVYLSSGWDSTAILAGLVYVFGASKVRGVIGRMRYSERSGVCNQIEIDKAQKMAEYFGVKLDMVDFEYVDKGPEFFQSTCSVMRAHQMYSVNALTHGKLAEFTQSLSNGNEVVFAGEISDGAHNLGFSQYATIFHPSYGFREYSDKMASYLFGPTFLSLLQKGEHEKDPIFNLFSSRLEGVKFDAVDPDPEKRTMQLLTSFFLRNGRTPFWSLENSRLLTSEGGSFYTEEMQREYLKEAAENATPKTIYSWYLHLYNSFHWQGSTVRTLSVLGDTYELKTDFPYWDGGLQKFLSAMPEEWGRGLDLNPTKYPLKWMLKNKIDYPYDLQKGPHSYTYDVDHSFNHYEEIFCHSKMKPFLQKAISGKPYHQILSPDVFDLEYIDGLVDDYLENKALAVASIADLAPVVLLSYIGWYGKKD